MTYVAQPAEPATTTDGAESPPAPTARVVTARDLYGCATESVPVADLETAQQWDERLWRPLGGR